MNTGFRHNISQTFVVCEFHSSRTILHGGLPLYKREDKGDFMS